MVQIHGLTMSEEIMAKVQQDVSNVTKLKPKPVEPKCLKCHTMCDSEDSLNTHVTLCYPVKRDIEFKCSKCDSIWGSAEALHYHLFNTHVMRACVCDICGAILTNYSYLGTHRSSHFNIKKWKCDQCDKSYTTKLAMESHYNAMHEQTQEFFCDHCDFKTFRKSDLSFHVKTKHIKDYFKCKVCDFASNSPKIVKSHMKKVHPGVQIKTKGFLMKI